MITKIKYFIGNTFHIKKWSNNYERNISPVAIYDVYWFVVRNHFDLYNNLTLYYKHRHIITPAPLYPLTTKMPTILISAKETPYKRMAYRHYTNTIFVHPSMLYINPIEYRAVLVHEMVHHVYMTIKLSYGGVRNVFNKHGIGGYEKDPEEFVADYWRLYYEGYGEDFIIDTLADWYFKGDERKFISKKMINHFQTAGYIPM